jgi:nicotinate-nucleotide adenylyltransferase
MVASIVRSSGLEGVTVEQKSNEMQSFASKKIGLLGGTFDPLHLTHLYIANVVKESCELDEIWFIPAKQPPHKEHKKISSEQDRIAMLSAAIEHIDYFKLCLIECEREGVSYTYDTVAELNQKYPQYTFFFIVGADMVDYLPNWYRIDELIQRITFIGIGRPGWSLAPGHRYESRITKVEGVPSGLSSSLIRELREQGKSIRFLVPEEVYQYIEGKQLYV